jgi:hypothetical protein
MTNSRAALEALGDGFEGLASGLDTEGELAEAAYDHKNCAEGVTISFGLSSLIPLSS